MVEKERVIIFSALLVNCVIKMHKIHINANFRSNFPERQIRKEFSHGNVNRLQGNINVGQLGQCGAAGPLSERKGNHPIVYCGYLISQGFRYNSHDL